ncbi:hypothetical protein ACFQ61_08330 [Streptomyces sp. NPDC056500]|uniref:hypothetical protein n=1 Tax=Streptomyces sp. NPDC056500 TaxID=3345840 RepID=UPI0036813262
MTGKKRVEGAVNLPGKGIWENNFDPRIRSIPSYLPGETGSSFGLMRGYMVTAFPKGNQSKNNRFYILNFLYNPSTINVGHSIDASNQIMPRYTASDEDSGVPLIAAGGTLNFALLFDRTYEMSDSTKFSTIEGTYGVMADIHVLYNLVGINSAQRVWNEGPTEAGDVATDGGDVIGVMQMNPVWCRFGQARHSFKDRLPGLSRMEYFGYVNNLGITYTHFSQRMTPMRCAVDISIQLMSSAGWV